MVEYQDGCFKKTKLAKFPEKVTFLTPLIHSRRGRTTRSEIFDFRKTWLASFSKNNCFEIRPFAF